MKIDNDYDLEALNESKESDQLSIFTEEKESIDRKVENLIKSGNRQIFVVSRKQMLPATNKKYMISPSKFYNNQLIAYYKFSSKYV